MKKWLKIFFARDKILHLLAGAAIAFVFGIWLSPAVGLAAGIVAGAGKEIVDKLGFGTPDYLDLFITVVGALIAAIILKEMA